MCSIHFFILASLTQEEKLIPVPTILERKRPPTTASIFGDTLTSLLSDPLVKPSKTRSTGANAVHVTPKSQSQLTTTISQPTKKQKPTPPTTGSTKNPNQKAQNEDKKENQKPKTIRNPILALSTRRLPPSQASISLEAKAARLLKLEKEEKEDRARVRDVLTGWTPAEPVPGAVGADGKEIVQVGSQEFERGLKKVAQRGGTSFLVPPFHPHTVSHLRSRPRLRSISEN